MTPQLRELTSLGDAAQRLFGAPQDVEWVIDAGGKVWLTQSRPITTLYPLPDPPPARTLARSAAAGRGHPRVSVRHAAPGPDPAPHADGTLRPGPR